MGCHWGSSVILSLLNIIRQLLFGMKYQGIFWWFCILAVTHDGQSRPGIASLLNSVIPCCADASGAESDRKKLQDGEMEQQEKLRNHAKSWASPRCSKSMTLLKTWLFLACWLWYASLKGPCSILISEISKSFSYQQSFAQSSRLIFAEKFSVYVLEVIISCQILPWTRRNCQLV